LLDGLDKDFPPIRSWFPVFRRDASWPLKSGRAIRGGWRESSGISGYVDEPEQLIRELSPVARQQRFLITHGTEDPLIPIQKTRRQIGLVEGGRTEN
jgi:hypothetical protein